jgi:hypothetical protein
MPDLVELPTIEALRKLKPGEAFVNRRFAYRDGKLWLLQRVVADRFARFVQLQGYKTRLSVSPHGFEVKVNPASEPEYLHLLRRFIVEEDIAP